MNLAAQVLLAAAPIALRGAPAVSEGAPSAAPTGDGLNALYILIGSTLLVQLVGGLFALFRWLGTRTVEREDKDKEDLRAKLKEHEQKFDELDDALSETDKSLTALQTEVKQVLHSLESIRGGVSEIKIGLDSRFEKQAEFYRTSLKDFIAEIDKKTEALEYQMRQDMTRAVADGLRTKRTK